MIPPDEPQRLAALRRYAVLDTPADAVFDRITALLARLLDVPIALISLVDCDRTWFKSHYGWETQQIGRDPGLCASAILQDDVYTVLDAQSDPRTRAHPLVVGEFGLRFYMAAPLCTDDGYSLGTLCAMDFQPRLVSPTEKKTLADLTAIVMNELNWRLMAARTAQIESELKQQLAACPPIAAPSTRSSRLEAAPSPSIDRPCSDSTPLGRTAGHPALRSEDAVGLRIWVAEDRQVDQQVMTLDPDVLKNYCKILNQNPATIVTQLIECYLEDASRYLQLLKKAADCRDLAALEQSAHSLKGASAAIGATRLAQLCKELEGSIRVGELPGAADQVARLEAEYRHVTTALLEQQWT